MGEHHPCPAYVVITPVRNEQENLPHTIKSVVSQTILPFKWVIVNDGSTDATGRLAAQAQGKHAWIEVVHRRDRGFRKPGGGVIEAFYDGYRCVEAGRWDFIMKLDGDLSFEPDCFARAFECFRAEPKLGIGGGSICTREGGALVPEWKGDPPFHVRGATKMYRAECWRDLGGLHAAPGWDTLDELKANMLGWKTRTFAELRMLHAKHAGKADGVWANWYKNGRANYITGYSPLFMLCKCATRFFKRPYGIAAMALICGFASGYANGLPQVGDVELIQYLRREQRKRLFFQSGLWG